MLYLKLSQVIAIEPINVKPYDFVDDSGKERKGTTIAATVTGLMTNGKVAIVKIKGKAAPEVETKLKLLALVIGKPAEFPVLTAANAGAVLTVNA